MHVIPQAGAVGRRVIITEDFQRRTAPERRRYRQGDEVRLWAVIFADGAILGRASRVEVTEGREAQPIRPRERPQGVLHIELGLPIGVDG